MNLKDAYLDIAERSLKAAEAALSAQIQESSSFYSYHAFESIGGALCEGASVSYPGAHPKKINSFVAVSSRGSLKNPLGRDIAALAILVSSVRNLCLYPRIDAGVAVPPSDAIDEASARDLLRRVRRVVGKVKRVL